MTTDELAIALKAELSGSYRVEKEGELWQLYVPTVNYPIASLVGQDLKFHPTIDRAVRANLQVLIGKLKEKEMKSLRFSGHSDDVFHYEEGNTGRGEETSLVGKVQAFKIINSKGDGLYVVGLYAPSPLPGACWVVGIAQLEDEIPLPSWKIEYKTAANFYSPELVVYAPTDAEVFPVPTEE